MIKFTINQRVTSKDNVKVIGRHGKYFLPREYKDWEKLVNEEAFYKTRGQMKEPFPLKSKLRMSIVFYMNNAGKRDVGNYQKSILDALQGVIYANDNEVWKLELEKKRATEEGEGMVITVEEIKNG